MLFPEEFYFFMWSMPRWKRAAFILAAFVVVGGIFWLIGPEMETPGGIPGASLGKDTATSECASVIAFV